MSKKHWITVKRGLSEDPKHREKMGMAIWCFLHLLDRADWETGRVYDWVDRDEAQEMGVKERTLRDWRQHLVDGGYISCQKRQRGQEIIIYNWINPKDYSSRVINPKIQSDTVMSDEEIPSDTAFDTPSDTASISKSVTPPLDQKSKVKSQKKESATPKATDIPELVLYREVVRHWCKPFQRDTVIAAVQKINSRLGRLAVADDITPYFIAWGRVSGNDWSLVWLDWAVSGVIPQNGKQQASSGVSKTQAAIAQFLGMTQNQEVVDVYPE